MHNINLASKQVDKKIVESKERLGISKKMSVFEYEAIQDIKDLASLRSYKIQGVFNNKFFATCPSYPKFHAAYGEPLVHSPLDEIQKEPGIAQNSVKLIGRIDSVEINEQIQEVYIKDDLGIYILYDCSLFDMKFLEEDLCKIGSYFLSRAEVLLDPSAKPYPYRDRQEVAFDLLSNEAEFQFNKVKLIQVYLECYEHISDPLEQQRLMQIITDIMAKRPRLNLQANYFVDAYNAEILCLKKQFELVQMCVDLQITLEKTENKRLQESLNLSYHLANLYSKNKWRYQDASQLLQAIQRTKIAKKDSEIQAQKQKNILERQEQFKKEKEAAEKLAFENPMANNLEKAFLMQLKSETENTQPTEDQFGQPEDNHFTKLLGLPTISIESIYQATRETDQNVIQLMREHSNFIQVYEGYPEFLTLLTHKALVDKTRTFKLSPWSQETGCLDFYDSLDFVNKLYSCCQQVQQELYTGLRMWDTTLMTQIDIQVAQFAIEELKNVIQIQDGSQDEYKGRCYVEDESIVGNSDKMIFLAKEMIGDITCKPKAHIDPYLVAKLDLDSILYFSFSEIEKENNKYIQRKNGIMGLQYMLVQEKNLIGEIAMQKTNIEKGEDGLGPGMSGKQAEAALSHRNLTVPSLLQTYCNMLELLRLRQEIVLATSEASALQQLYLDQCEMVNERNRKLIQDECINFCQQDQQDEDKNVNFFEDGSSHLDDIKLAVSEFDSGLLSNFNFRNPDTFKLNILTSGLEEVRAILQYQVLQKQLLIVATRINSQLLDGYERAISESNLLGTAKAAIPNSILNYKKLIQNSIVITSNQINNLKLFYKQLASQQCQPGFFNIMQKKTLSKSTIIKNYTNFKTEVSRTYGHSVQCVDRIMRSYRVSLVTKFVQKSLIELYLNAQKVQAVQVCQRIRNFNRYFSLFRYETASFLESQAFNYLPEELKEDEDKFAIKQEYKVIQDYQILDYFGIPSSLKLIQIDAAPKDDIDSFKAKANIKQNDQELTQIIQQPEVYIKGLLPTYTPYNHIEILQTKDAEQYIAKKLGKSGGHLLEYSEGLYFGDSQFAYLMRYYLSLERIMGLEWFITQLEFKQDEIIHFHDSIESGLLVFESDQFDQRRQVQKIEKSNINKLTQDILMHDAASLRTKKNLENGMSSLKTQITNVIKKFAKTKDCQFLNNYNEFRFQQIVGSLHQLVQEFYQKNNQNAVQKVKSAISLFSNLGHINVIYLKPHNYSVKSCLVGPNYKQLESSNLFYGSMTNDENQQFFKCVEPIMNQKALEPSQITLMQSIYQHDINPSTQFAGQVKKSQNFTTALIDLGYLERQFCQQAIFSFKYQANDFMESVYQDNSMKTFTNEDVYDLQQMQLAKKFMNETTTAILLKVALICWQENNILPDDPLQYKVYDENFKRNFFWKQLQQKDEITKKIQIIQTFGQIPSSQQLQALKHRIQKLVEDQSLATESALKQRDELVEALRAEFMSQKKKVILDQYFNTKAQIAVFSNEIEKLIIEASVRTLDSECLALSKCFSLMVPTIQYHIHPFQQFAATLFDQVDPNYQLDVVNKVNAIQELLTRIRNRGTEVETLTAGPGIVVTLKDMSEIIMEFCRTTIFENLKQQKSQKETSMVTEGHLRHLLYNSERKINNLELRVGSLQVNLENIVNTRLFEKGNQLIYELDSSNRILKIFKNFMFRLETQLSSKILGDQLEKFKRKNNQVELKDKKFEDYKQAIMSMIEADFAQEQDQIRQIIKQKAENAKNTHESYIKPIMFKSPKNGQVPNPLHPWPTMELAELDQISEQEARNELRQAYILIRKQRLLYRTKEMCLMTKYQKQINILEEKQNSNETLWSQLAESQKRERVIKEELSYTQQSLSDAEKKIDTLINEIRKVDAERNRLFKFKQQKVETIKELENVVKKVNLFENIDSEKLVQTLISKNESLVKLQKEHQNFQSIIEVIKQRKDFEVHKYKKAFQQSQVKAQEITDKMEQLKLEIRMMEQNDASVTSIWKKKCLDLFEVCQSIKLENETLRSRCVELINQGLYLADTLSQIKHNKGEEANSISTVLPDLVVGISRTSSNVGRNPVNRQGSDVNKITQLKKQTMSRHGSEVSKLLQNQKSVSRKNTDLLNVVSEYKNEEVQTKPSIQFLPETNLQKEIFCDQHQFIQRIQIQSQGKRNFTQRGKSLALTQRQQKQLMSPMTKSQDIKQILNGPYTSQTQIRPIQTPKRNAQQRQSEILRSHQQETEQSSALQKLKSVNRFSKEFNVQRFEMTFLEEKDDITSKAEFN